MFALSKILWWVASPGNLIVACLCVGLFARLVGLRRIGRWLIVLATAFCLALTVTPLKPWVLGPLQNRFPQIAAPAKVDGVIVLGGAIDTAMSKQRGVPVINESAERLFAAAELARRYPEARVLYSGGTASLVEGDALEADIAESFFTAMGLPPERMLYERESRNTYENARFSLPIANPRPGETWLLVTSAYHMPRAVGVFRAIGWNVTAYPVDFAGGVDDNEIPFSFLEGLSGFNWAVREWIGLAYYWAGGRTDSLFPGPIAPPVPTAK